MSDEKPRDVIPFRPREKSTDQRDQEYKTAAHAEAVEMLEHLLELAKTRPIAGLAIATVFADGGVQTSTPNHPDGWAALIGTSTAVVRHLSDKAWPD